MGESDDSKPVDEIVGHTMIESQSVEAAVSDAAPVASFTPPAAQEAALPTPGINIALLSDDRRLRATERDANRADVAWESWEQANATEARNATLQREEGLGSEGRSVGMPSSASSCATAPDDKKEEDSVRGSSVIAHDQEEQDDLP